MKTRGIFEKFPGSGVWWIRYVDFKGRLRREKAGTKSAAILLYRKRKQEALEGRKLPEKLRRPRCPRWQISRSVSWMPSESDVQPNPGLLNFTSSKPVICWPSKP